MTPKQEFVANALINWYVERFPEFNHLNGPKGARNETWKWNALQVFQENWNLDAENFDEMWKACQVGMSLDTNYESPAAGIGLLLKQPQEQEFVRNAFRELFENESNVKPADLQRRIEKFVKTVNDRILMYSPGTKIYLQDKDAVIVYLSLFDPDHNYRFMCTPAEDWAKYMGSDDRFSGSRFNLGSYYAMCDELLEPVKNHAELQKVHATRFTNGLKDYDQAQHLLTFDVIYCCREAEKAWRAAEKEWHKEEKASELVACRAEIVRLQSELQTLKDSLTELHPEGEQVRSLKYGLGTVEQFDPQTDTMTVAFAKETKKMKCQVPFASGTLKPAAEDSKLKAYVAHIGEINDLAEQLARLQTKETNLL